MAASEAQIIANRLNARLSTGPRTEAGKERSRRNSLKHGLTADVVVPGEEAGEAAERVAAVQASLAADGDGLALILAERAGYLSLRLRRCYQHEEAMTAMRARAAQADHDDRCRAAAEALMGQVAAEPEAAARRLRGTPEGVDLLVARLEALRGQVDARWGAGHADRFDEATGVRPGSTPRSRVRALTDLATGGDASGVEPGEVDAIPADGRRAWALGEIAREVEAELRRLHAHRATLDHARFEADRAEAPRRALQGDDRATALAKKYEGAAERALARTLAQLDAYRAERRRARAEEQAAEQALLAPVPAASADDRPAPGAGLGSFVPKRDFERAPTDASDFAIGKPPTDPSRGPKPPRATP